MPGKTAAERRALAAVRATVTGVFEAAGFELIEPEVLQPADVFLDRSGEDIRSRTYVFADLSGNELCLRPDLTVPTCRYHLSHKDDPRTEARYAYTGPAFRYEPPGADSLHPREFDQAGVEWFGASDAEAADAAVFALAIASLRAAGLKTFSVKTGDLALFEALLASLDIPDRWRTKLRRQFWRPRAFRVLLDVLTGRAARARSTSVQLAQSLGRASPAEATAFVEKTLEERGLDLVRGRSAAEIAERLSEQAQDLVETPISARDSSMIDAYLAIRGRPDAVIGALEGLGAEVGGTFPAAVAALKRRVALVEAAVPGLADVEFSTVFGRSLEYYTGFVFQIEVPGPDRLPVSVVGGGRYDTMLSDIGSPWPVPSVGFAIHTERLVAATQAGSA
ncbi:MAG: ATP phosphoribosyltransferase regulatory subunit [Hyphomicrobiales bacterium]